MGLHPLRPMAYPFDYLTTNIVGSGLTSRTMFPSPLTEISLTRLIGMKKFSLKEIASMLKFSSPTYFGYAYEAFYGHPPSADLRK